MVRRTSVLLTTRLCVVVVVVPGEACALSWGGELLNIYRNGESVHVVDIVIVHYIMQDTSMIHHWCMYSVPVM